MDEGRITEQLMIAGLIFYNYLLIEKWIEKVLY